MKKTDAIAHFDSKSKLAKVLGIAHSSVSQWGEIIPEKQALRLDRITNGELEYNWKLYAAPDQTGHEKSEAA
jgi:DNA-binding transcriptional regulator YdaS (Cro superfamily)